MTGEMERLREFALRIREKGVADQQYVADGILELLEKREAFADDDFPEAGTVVADKLGNRWRIEGREFICVPDAPLSASRFSLEDVRFMFSSDEIGKDVVLCHTY